ncbi:MAG: hypothetical protein HYU58_04065 [Proteobacteria bacterium]|nr:hypothetical protein [Pseudomonadota bacterium]
MGHLAFAAAVEAIIAGLLYPKLPRPFRSTERPGADLPDTASAASGGLDGGRKSQKLGKQARHGSRWFVAQQAP